MDALFSINVFFADLPSGWIWGHSGEDGEGWVRFGVAIFWILVVGYFMYDTIVCSKWWDRNVRGKMKEQIDAEKAGFAALKEIHEKRKREKREGKEER